MAKTWKDHLLRSGVPLEYEVAQVFAKHGFSIDADFSFLRRDVSGLKEWSTDIYANWFGPADNDVAFEFAILTECKYRSPEKFVLFLEDPNELDSPVTLGGTVNVFDAFVDFTLPLDRFVSLDGNLTFVYKGIELHDGGAVEEDLRHGIQQLRYASPALMRRIIDWQLPMSAEDRLAIYFTKILVTNAPIWILNPGTGIEAIKSVSEIKNIASPAETVILYSDYGPDYEDHTESIFADPLSDRKRKAVAIRDELKRKGVSRHFGSDPVDFISSFSGKQMLGCRKIGTQFFITTLSGLPDLLMSLKKACLDSYAARRKPTKA